MTRVRYPRLLAPPIAAGVLFTLAAFAPAEAPRPADAPATRTGPAALGDWTTDAPGVRRKMTTLDDLPSAVRDPSRSTIGPKVVKRPDGAWPKAPDGLQGHANSRPACLTPARSS